MHLPLQQFSKRYSLTALPGDLMGGLLAAVVALPLALAFGVASGLGAAAGLYGAIACGIFAALFGGTPGQVSGPTGPMTVVVSGMIAAHTQQPELIFAAILFAGVFQLLLGTLRVGNLIHYIPYPVISGFMTGIGLIIILVEIPPLFGLKTPANALEGIRSLASIPGHINPEALALGVFTLSVIYGLPRFIKRIPPALVALILATLAIQLLGLQVPQIRDVGKIPSVLPIPVWPGITLSDFFIIIMPAAFSLATLGAIDSLLTSVVVDRMTHRQHHSNRELIGQGIGNMVSGLIGGLPGAGATMRSVVNIQNGGNTRLSGIIHGLILLGILMGFGAYAEQIPLACLAGILISVGISIMDYRGLKSIGKAPADDVLVMLMVLGLTVFLDLIMAVLVGLSIATFLFCKRFADLETSSHGHLDAITTLHDRMHQIPQAQREGMYLYTFNGPLYFGEARNFKNVLAQVTGIKLLILDFRDVSLIDQTGAYAIQDILRQYHLQNRRVLLIGLSSPLRQKLAKLHVLPPHVTEDEFDTLEAALSVLS